MAPIKFEEKIKEKLEQRTIEPSADSWSRLSKRLDEESSSKNPRLFWWIGIAASIIIILAVSIQYYGGNTAQEVMPQIVEEQKVNEKINEINSVISTEEQLEKVVEASTSLESSKEEMIGQINKATPDSQKSTTKYTGNTQIASVDKAFNEKQTNPKEEIREKNNLLNEPSVVKETVVAEMIQNLNNSGSEKDIEEEVDSLLKLASKELFKNKLKEESTKTVDAKALLESVQEDMGQSFRTRVFEALKDSYITVRTAVAERNN